MLRYILRATLFAGLLFAASDRPLHAQANGENQATADSNPNENPDTKWHLINTAIFAIGLGWAIWKMAPAFFNARSADIQRAIKEATGLKMQADLRYSEIDRKMATLPEEVKRIQEASAAEVEALRQDAIRTARQRTARGALQLAEERLAARVSGASNDELLRDFIHLVERGKN